MRLAPLALFAATLATPALSAPELVADMATGQVIHARDAQVPWHPASLTKLMTTYVALRAVASGTLPPDVAVTVSAAARRAPPSRSGLPLGARLGLGDALRVLMVKSANDLAVGIAEAVGGDVERFVSMMNAEAARLGMTSTRWRNPHGLHDPAQVTTARDLAVLAVAMARDFPTMSALFRIPAVSLNGVVMTNHNNAIGRWAEADGMKTGYICPSGFNVVTTATRGGRRLVAVVLGQDRAMQRDALATLLLQAAFQSTGPAQAVDLASLSGTSRPAPPPRACGSRAVDEDGPTGGEGAARWARSFAATPRVLGEPIQIRSLPPVGPPSASAMAESPPAPRPEPAAAMAPAPLPAAASAYVAPRAPTPPSSPLAAGPRRF